VLDSMFVTAVSGIGRQSHFTIRFPIILDCPSDESARVPTSARSHQGRHPKSRWTTQRLSASSQGGPFEAVDLPQTARALQKYRGRVNRSSGGHRSVARMPQCDDPPASLRESSNNMRISPQTKTPRIPHSQMCRL
jgi:hypothetical protein